MMEFSCRNLWGILFVYYLYSNNLKLFSFCGAFTTTNPLVFSTRIKDIPFPVKSVLSFSKNNNDFGTNVEEDNDDDDDDDDDYIDIDNLQMSPDSLSNSLKTMSSFGPGKGRSSPSQRKAMGKSGSGDATVHVCTNCGAEYVKWMGRCSTCQEWNTIQEFRVGRGGAADSIGGNSSKSRPIFGSTRGLGADIDNESGDRRPSSWLTGINSMQNDFYNEPVRITDVYKQLGYNDKDFNDHDTMISREKRIYIPGDEELNNVLGGGLMPGSLTLLGGDPGVGKSTLLLQMAGQVASLSTPPRGIGMGADDESVLHYGPVLYVSGEENSVQIASRAMRLGIDQSELLLFCETDADFIAETAASYSDVCGFNIQNEDVDNGQSNSAKKNKMAQELSRRRQPSLIVIDSIQTMICDSGGSSAAGGVTQVRECVGLFLRLAKSTGIPIILVGHVTKAGGVAGPRTVEHMVDCVLYLENSTPSAGEGTNLRMLRASKNRFGSSDEVGVYEMSGSRESGRLIPVSDPSSLFLANRLDSNDVEGCAISIILEGMRPISVEVQALVTQVDTGKSFSGRRTVDGLSPARLLLILAVLQKRCSISFSRNDVYANVVGGIRLSSSKKEGSSSDLAIAVALVSSLVSIPVRSDTAFVGEIGLLGKLAAPNQIRFSFTFYNNLSFATYLIFSHQIGELRQVSSIEKRVNEARRMGFSRIIIPKQNDNRKKMKSKQFSNTKSQLKFSGIDCIEVEDLMSAIEIGLVTKIPKRRKKTTVGRDTDKDQLPIFDDEDNDDEWENFNSLFE